MPVRFAPGSFSVAVSKASPISVPVPGGGSPIDAPQSAFLTISGQMADSVDLILDVGTAVTGVEPQSIKAELYQVGVGVVGSETRPLSSGLGVEVNFSLFTNIDGIDGIFARRFFFRLTLSAAGVTDRVVNLPPFRLFEVLPAITIGGAGSYAPSITNTVGQGIVTVDAGIGWLGAGSTLNLAGITQLSFAYPVWDGGILSAIDFSNSELTDIGTGWGTLTSTAVSDINLRNNNLSDLTDFNNLDFSFVASGALVDVSGNQLNLAQITLFLQAIKGDIS